MKVSFEASKTTRHFHWKKKTFNTKLRVLSIKVKHHIEESTVKLKLL